YDYDSVTLYVAHLVDMDQPEPPPLTEILDGFPGVSLRQPEDCVVVNQNLIISESGGTLHKNAVHIWQIASP
ncbi:MAG: hypothetical protein ACOCX5_04115, partial [Chloroflexota bacterium]